MPPAMTSRASRRPVCPAWMATKCLTKKLFHWPHRPACRCSSFSPDFFGSHLKGVHMFRSVIAIFFAALWLTGCSTTRLVDTDVRSYATPPLVPVGARYRFERLPSQQDQADTAEQTQLEAIVQPVLAKAGLQRDDAAAGYSVQISVDVKVDPYAPWDQSSIGWWPGFNFGRGVHGGNVWFVNHHSFRGWSGFGMSELPYYWYQVS